MAIDRKMKSEPPTAFKVRGPGNDHIFKDRKVGKFKDRKEGKFTGQKVEKLVQYRQFDAPQKKKPVTIRLDSDVIEYFQEWAGREGKKYQPYINAALRTFLPNKRRG